MKNKQHKPKPEIKENDCSMNGVDGAKRVDHEDEESMETMETCKHECCLLYTSPSPRD